MAKYILTAINLDNAYSSGTLTSTDLSRLTESKTNYIIYGTELYKLVDNNRDGDLLTYICITKADSIIKVKSIIVRISTLAWQFSELTDSSAAALSELTPKVMRALLTPVSAPSKTELVGVDDGNAQTMIEIGDGIVLENGVLKSKYWEEVIYSGDELFKTNTTYNFTKAVGSYETIELELRSGGHNSSTFVKMKTIPSVGSTYIYIPDHSESSLNQIAISFTDTSMTVENSLMELTDYDNWVLQKIRWIHR